MRKKLFIVISLVLLIGIGTGIYLYNGKNNSSNSSNVVSSISYNDIDYDSDMSSYETIDVNLDSVSKVYKISKAAIYHFTGKLDGYIDIEVNDNVKIILDNVTINNSNGSCIYVGNANNVYIELIGKNKLSDGNSYSGFLEEVNAVIYSHDDLIMEGNGSLEVNANYQDGIVSKDDLVIKSGEFNIVSHDDGIRGRDSVTIIDGNFTIKSGGDGIKSTNDTESDKGNILIKAGTFNITSDKDGIDSINGIEIDNGEFNIVTGNGASISSKSNMWNNAGSDTESIKGIKANGNIKILDGKFTIDANDDGIHSNSVIEINSGDINIKSSDDGIHADGMVVINNGNIDITASEGIEATYVKIQDGNIKIDASDDGINALYKSSSYDTSVEINGGTINITMGQGDTDGIDSNGNIYINGGTVNITGNSAFDYDGEAKYNGGTIIVNGEKTTTITNQMMGGGMGPRMGGRR